MLKWESGASGLWLAPRKAARAYLKGMEAADTPTLLGEDRRASEPLFEPSASASKKS